jgi:microcystin-dependent protein
MADSDVFVGQILLVPFNFAPQGYAFCQGQSMPISQNTALFSLLGTRYGGNGVTTFSLPNLQGRAPIGFGQGQGLTNRIQGAAPGAEVETLTTDQIASHGHSVNPATLTATARCKNGAGDQSSPAGHVPAIEAPSAAATYSSGAPDTNMRSGAIVLGGAVAGNTGSGATHSNLAPYLTLNFVIALQGVFPSPN